MALRSRSRAFCSWGWSLPSCKMRGHEPTHRSSMETDLRRGGATRRHQRASEGIRAHQSSSEVIIQKLSLEHRDAPRSHQRGSKEIKGDQGEDKGDQGENKGDRDAPRSRAHVDEAAVDLLQRAASMSERRTPGHQARSKGDQGRSAEIQRSAAHRASPSFTSRPHQPALGRHLPNLEPRSQNKRPHGYRFASRRGLSTGTKSSPDEEGQSACTINGTRNGFW